MPDPRIVVWSWSGCPSHDDIMARIATVLAELGRPEEPVDVRWIETQEDAEAQRFVGSPTVCVGGVDLVEPDQPLYGLTCRVYRAPDGRATPLPDRTTMLERMRELL